MVRATIRVEGMAIVYYDSTNKKFRVLFPFDSDHDHSVMIRTNLNPERPLAAAKRRVEMIATPIQASTPPDNFHEFLDITANYAHDIGVEKITNWDQSAVLLTIPNAEFFRSGMTNCQYGLYEGNTTKLVPKYIGYNGIFTIEAEREIVMDISGREVPGYVSPVQITNGMNVYFNNTCGNCPTTDQDSDFRMIYQVLRETGAPNRRLKMDRLGSEKPPRGVQKGLLSRTSLIRLLELLAKLLGGWMPFPLEILNNPGVQQEGLPCNIVVASDSDGLPKG